MTDTEVIDRMIERDPRRMVRYRLPDGSIIRVPIDVCRLDLEITHQLLDGSIVTAFREPSTPVIDTLRRQAVRAGLDANEKLTMLIRVLNDGGDVGRAMVALEEAATACVQAADRYAKAVES